MNRKDEQQGQNLSQQQQDSATRQAGSGSDRFGSQNQSQSSGRNVDSDVDADDEIETGSQGVQPRADKAGQKQEWSKDQSSKTTSQPTKGKM